MAASLFDPVSLGAIDAPNRILMAPLTRARNTRGSVPTPMMAQYYAQRASAGLIISEATAVSETGMGWPFAPGLWKDEQVEGWSAVTEAVHAKGGRIFAQLWHMGRLVHPDYRRGQAPVGPSEIAAPGDARTYDGKKPNATPKALDRDGIAALVEEHRNAARNALAAGFDGVQLHAANGYLIDQFLRDSSNHRTDAYGGSIPNRLRLLLELTEAVAGVVGEGRTAVRLSPTGAMQGVDDSNPEALFNAAASALSKLRIAFLELREPGANSTFHAGSGPQLSPSMRRSFDGALVLNSDYTYEQAQAKLADGSADAISFGRPFIANPDLPDRFAKHIPLATPDVVTYYTQGATGYTDYPPAGVGGRNQARLEPQA